MPEHSRQRNEFAQTIHALPASQAPPLAQPTQLRQAVAQPYLERKNNLPTAASKDDPISSFQVVGRDSGASYVDSSERHSYTYQGAAERFWKQWYNRAIRSRIEPLKKFARRLKEYLPGILAHCRWPLHTSLLEGINNKIKVIKRMAYGFRDDQYFFLKIRDAFPGIAG